MQEVQNVVSMIAEQLKKMARTNAVVSKPISFGDRHVLPLCEIGLGFGGGGGSGEELADGEQSGGQGTGSGTAGAACATPVAVIVVDGKERKWFGRQGQRDRQRSRRRSQGQACRRDRIHG